jgi:predicted nucleic acid-binding protein
MLSGKPPSTATPPSTSWSAIFCRASFWDALVAVAAAKSGAKRRYTEGLQDGQVILGVEVVNPFRASQKIR